MELERSLYWTEHEGYINNALLRDSTAAQSALRGSTAKACEGACSTAYMVVAKNTHTGAAVTVG